MKKVWLVFLLSVICSAQAMEREELSEMQKGMQSLPIEIQAQVLKNYLSSAINKIVRNKSIDNSAAIMSGIARKSEAGFILSQEERLDYLKRLASAVFSVTGNDLSISDNILINTFQVSSSNQLNQLNELRKKIFNFGFSIEQLISFSSPESFGHGYAYSFKDKQISDLRGIQFLDFRLGKRVLDLRNNRIYEVPDDIGQKLSEDNRGIPRIIYIGGNPLSREERQKLKNALPNIIIAEEPNYDSDDMSLLPPY